MRLPEVNHRHSGKKVTSLKSRRGTRWNQNYASTLHWHPSYPPESIKQEFWVLSELYNINTSFMVVPTAQCQISHFFLSSPFEVGAVSVSLQPYDLTLRVSDDQENNCQLLWAAVPEGKLPVTLSVNWCWKGKVNKMEHPVWLLVSVDYVVSNWAS